MVLLRLVLNCCHLTQHFCCIRFLLGVEVSELLDSCPTFEDVASRNAVARAVASLAALSRSLTRPAFAFSALA